MRRVIRHQKGEGVLCAIRNLDEQEPARLELFPDLGKEIPGRRNMFENMNETDQVKPARHRRERAGIKLLHAGNAFNDRPEMFVDFVPGQSPLLEGCAESPQERAVSAAYIQKSSAFRQRGGRGKTLDQPLRTGDGGPGDFIKYALLDA